MNTRYKNEGADIAALNNLTNEELQALDDAIIREKERRRVSKIKKAAEMFDAAFKYCEENHLSVGGHISEVDKWVSIDKIYTYYQ